MSTSNRKLPQTGSQTGSYLEPEVVPEVTSRHIQENWITLLQSCQENQREAEPNYITLLYKRIGSHCSKENQRKLRKSISKIVRVPRLKIHKCRNQSTKARSQPTLNKSEVRLVVDQRQIRSAEILHSILLQFLRTSTLNFFKSLK